MLWLRDLLLRLLVLFLLRLLLLFLCGSSLGLPAFGLEGSSGSTAGALAFGGGLFQISGSFGEGPNTKSPTPANRAAARARTEVFRSSHELRGTLKPSRPSTALAIGTSTGQEKGLRDGRPPQSIVAREGSLSCRRTTLYSGHSQFLDPPMDRDLSSKGLCCSLPQREPRLDQPVRVQDPW